MTPTQTTANIHVQNVMERFPITVAQTDTIEVAVDTMVNHHISAVPVVDRDGKLHGILTITDVLRIIQSDERMLDAEDFGDESELTVASILCELLLSNGVETAMTAAVCTLQPEDSLEDAARLMLEHQVHHLPVVNQTGGLVGIVSTVHFVRLAVEGGQPGSH